MAKTKTVAVSFDDIRVGDRYTVTFREYGNRTVMLSGTFDDTVAGCVEPSMKVHICGKVVEFTPGGAHLFTIDSTRADGTTRFFVPWGDDLKVTREVPEIEQPLGVGAVVELNGWGSNLGKHYALRERTASWLHAWKVIDPRYGKAGNGQYAWSSIMDYAVVVLSTGVCIKDGFETS